jgi:hypothetical protein
MNKAFRPGGAFFRLFAQNLVFFPQSVQPPEKWAKYRGPLGPDQDDLKQVQHGIARVDTAEWLFSRKNPTLHALRNCT